MGMTIKISLGFLAALCLSGCSGFAAPAAEESPLASTQATVAAQTLPATLLPIPSPTLTNTPTPNKPANQPPSTTATATTVLPVALGTPFLTPSTPITAGNVSGLRELAVFGSPGIYEAVLSANGKLLFLATSAGVEIFETDTGRLVGNLDLVIRDDPTPGDLAVSTDGSIMLGVTRTGIQVVGTNDGRALWQFPRRLSPYGSVALSPDGNLAAIADCAELEACTFQVFRIADGAVVFIGKGAQPLFSPDGRWFAADVERSLWIWDTTSWRKTQHIWLENPAETTPTFSPDGELLAVGRSDKVEIWRIAERKVIRAIVGFAALAYEGLPVSFSPDSGYIAVLDASRQWQVFEIASGKLLQTLDLPQASIAYWDDNQLKGYYLPESPNYSPGWNAKALRFVDQDSARAFPYFPLMDNGTVSSEVCRLSMTGEMTCIPTKESLVGIDLISLASPVGSSRPIEVVAVL